MTTLACHTNVTNRIETPSDAVASFVHYCQELLTDLISKLSAANLLKATLVLLDVNLNMGDGMIADSLMQADIGSRPTAPLPPTPSVVRMVNAFLVLIKKQFVEQCPKFADESGTSQPPVLTVNLRLGKHHHYGMKVVYEEPVLSSLLSLQPEPPVRHPTSDGGEGSGSRAGAARPAPARPRAPLRTFHGHRDHRDSPILFGPIRRGDAADFFLGLRSGRGEPY